MRRITACLVLLTALPSVLPAAGAAPFPGRRVASFRQGHLPSQIGIEWAEGDAPYDEGPGGLAIGPHGDIYIGDHVNGQIKRFTAKGAFVTATQVRLTDWASFCVDDDGSIFVRDTAPDIVMTVRNGMRFVERPERIVKLDRAGKLVWVRALPDVISSEALTQVATTFGLTLDTTSAFYRVAAGPPGTVLASVPAYRKGVHGSVQMGLLLDAQGKLVRALPGFWTWSKGLWWGYQSSMVDNHPPPTITLTAYTPEGAEAKRIPLDTKAQGGRPYRGVQTGLQGVFPDGAGGCYVIAPARRARPYRVSEGHAVNSDHVALHYDSQGRFLREVRFPAGVSGRVLATAPNGTLYYLLVTRTGFDLMAVDPVPPGKASAL